MHFNVFLWSISGFSFKMGVFLQSLFEQDDRQEEGYAPPILGLLPKDPHAPQVVLTKPNALCGRGSERQKRVL